MEGWGTGEGALTLWTHGDVVINGRGRVLVQPRYQPVSVVNPVKSAYPREYITKKHSVSSAGNRV